MSQIVLVMLAKPLMAIVVLCLVRWLVVKLEPRIPDCALKRILYFSWRT